MSNRRDAVANTGNGFSYEEPLLFERSQSGRVGHSVPEPDVPAADPADLFPAAALREDIPGLPEVSEVDVVRHFTRLSTWNAAVDLGLPLVLGHKVTRLQSYRVTIGLPLVLGESGAVSAQVTIKSQSYKSYK